MLNLLLYLVVGLCACVVVAIDEVIMAKNNGFAVFDYLDWFSKNTQDVKCGKSWNVFAFIWGLLIWPIRVLVMYTDQYDRFKAYKAYIEKKSS